ncbi:MAG TPA: SIR2 family protein [Chthoniobacterales bacterium]|nr:SIR2 family protein [Chthoniobacterales bacterium]
MDDIAAIAESVAKGQCILFLGAGVHYGPPADADPRYLAAYPEDRRPPLGGALSEKLAGESEFLKRFPGADSRDLKRVGWHYEDTLSRNRLMKRIKEEVSGNKIASPVVRALAALDFPLVMTTNFDQLFERSLRELGKQPQLCIYSPSAKNPTEDPTDDPTPATPFVCKLHGDVDEPESAVVTDEDYIQFVLRMGDKAPFHPVPETFLYRFKRWPTLFVGYSLIDYNLRLLFKAMRVNLDPALFPETYSIDPKPDQLIVRYWSDQRRYVRFVTQDVWSFVPALYELIKKAPMPV